MSMRPSNALVGATSVVLAVITMVALSTTGRANAAAGPSTPTTSAATANATATSGTRAVRKTVKKPAGKKTVTKNAVVKKPAVKNAGRTPASVAPSVAGVTITAPIPTVAPVATTTSTSAVPPVATTVPQTTTTAPPAVLVAPFDVVAVAERVDAVVGTTVAFSIVIAQRGASHPIVLSLVGLPNGMGATLTPNPATGLAVLRIAVPSDAIAADYPLRVLGSFNGAQAWANLTLRVIPVPASTTTSTTTTTVDPSGLPASFGFRVTPDGKSLVTGGQVQYEIEPIYDTGYNGSIEYFVSGLPDGVWHGFSEKVTTKKTTLWLSSTVSLRNGRYPFTITGVSKGLKKSGEVLLIIG